MDGRTEPVHIPTRCQLQILGHVICLYTHLQNRARSSVSCNESHVQEYASVVSSVSSFKCAACFTMINLFHVWCWIYDYETHQLLGEMIGCSSGSRRTRYYFLSHLAWSSRMDVLFSHRDHHAQMRSIPKWRYMYGCVLFPSDYYERIHSDKHNVLFHSNHHELMYSIPQWLSRTDLF